MYCIVGDKEMAWSSAQHSRAAIEQVLHALYHATPNVVNDYNIIYREGVHIYNEWH